MYSYTRQFVYMLCKVGNNEVHFFFHNSAQIISTFVISHELTYFCWTSGGGVLENPRGHQAGRMGRAKVMMMMMMISMYRETT